MFALKREMSTNNKKKQAFYYRQISSGKSYSTKDYWCPGDVIKKEDEELLKDIKAFYQREGYSPSRKEIPLDLVCRLKSRFRTWKNVMLAAGLPELNSADAQKKRKDAAEKKRD